MAQNPLLTTYIRYKTQLGETRSGMGHVLFPFSLSSSLHLPVSSPLTYIIKTFNRAPVTLKELQSSVTWEQIKLLTIIKSSVVWEVYANMALFQKQYKEEILLARKSSLSVDLESHCFTYQKYANNIFGRFDLGMKLLANFVIVLLLRQKTFADFSFSLSSR